MLPQQQRGLHARALHISKHMLRAEVLLMPFWALYDGDLESSSPAILFALLCDQRQV